ncbi:MAG: ATP-binding protein [Bacteroidota bacterium]|nr:ATP-binding protein [Bacteroidota bacterium]
MKNPNNTVSELHCKIEALENELISLKKINSENERIIESLRKVQCSSVSSEEKVTFAFDSLDINGSEAIEQKELYKKLISAYPDAIVHADIAGDLTYVSDKSIELFGYKNEEEIIGRNLLEFVEEDLRAKVKKNLMAVFSGGKFPNSLYKLIRVDGSTFWGEINSALVLDSKGKPKNIIITIRDVSERIYFGKTQQALYRISEAVNSTDDLYNLYKSLHEIVKELMPAENFYIALYDPDFDVLSFPYYADKYDEAPQPRKLRKGLTEYVLRTGKDILVNEAVDMALSEAGEIELVGKPAPIWLGIALKLSGKTIGVMAVQDYENEKAYGEQEKQLLIFVSEQIASAIDKKRQEEALLRFTEELQISRDMLEERASEFARLSELLAASEIELQELNASKDKFFSILAHDLRSPFNGLLGFSNILVEDLDGLSKEEIKSFVTQIHGSAKTLFNLIENLLQWSRLQSGKIQCQPIKLDISDVVNDVISVLIGNAIRKNISLKSELSPYSFVYADQNMSYSIIQNLTANAIKFTDNGGEVRISAVEKEDFYSISVSDNGIGIKAEDMQKLFRIDVQHTTLGTAREKGTGLGLILCKDLIEKQGGSLSVESFYGKGTTFSFTLPKFMKF